MTSTHSAGGVGRASEGGPRLWIRDLLRDVQAPSLGLEEASEDAAERLDAPELPNRQPPRACGCAAALPPRLIRGAWSAVTIEKPPGRIAWLAAAAAGARGCLRRAARRDDAGVGRGGGCIAAGLLVLRVRFPPGLRQAAETLRKVVGGVPAPRK